MTELKEPTGHTKEPETTKPAKATKEAKVREAKVDQGQYGQRD
jgi:hypothetical protein